MSENSHFTIKPIDNTKKTVTVTFGQRRSAVVRFVCTTTSTNIQVASEFACDPFTFAFLYISLLRPSPHIPSCSTPQHPNHHIQHTHSFTGHFCIVLCWLIWSVVSVPSQQQEFSNICIKCVRYIYTHLDDGLLWRTAERRKNI